MAGALKTCRFCLIRDGAMPSYRVAEDAVSFSILDHRPLFAGHCILLPKTHYETLADVPPEVIEPLFRRAQKLSLAMETVLGAEGSFVAINNRVSQSVPHLHIHVVPRRFKDGLRGFFWPRTRYENEEQAREVCERLRRGLAGTGGA
jgi:histidine triad (HIT) family protein